MNISESRVLEAPACAKEKPRNVMQEVAREEKRLAAKTPRRAQSKTAASKASKAKNSTSGQHNSELGRRGEKAAARFLDRCGYDIIERNWVCAAGEADIIARDGDVLVFVEVKTRSSVEKGLPEEAVNKAKRTRYEKIAALFLQNYDAVDIAVRFDVVSLVVVGSDRAFVRHHINAFSAG